MIRHLYIFSFNENTTAGQSWRVARGKMSVLTLCPVGRKCGRKREPDVTDDRTGPGGS